MAADVDFEWWGIHPAADAQAQPAYVERDADTPLRAAMTGMLETGGLLIVVGRPASGKARTTAAAVLHVCPEWRLYTPVDVGDALAADRRRTVLWLKDFHARLDTRTWTEPVIRRLLDPERGPTLIVGTMWPGAWDRYWYEAAGPIDPYGEVRRVLGRAVRIDLPATLTEAEWQRAGRLPRELGPTVAGSDVLLRHCRGGSRTDQAVIAAAVTARRCGHPDPIPGAVLRALTKRDRPPPDRATRPAIGELAALTGDEPTGYVVSDLLLDRWPRKAVPAVDWSALVRSADLEALPAIAAAALQAGLPDIALAAAERATEAPGDPGARAAGLYLAGMLHRARGAVERGEELLAEAAEVGSVEADYALGLASYARGDGAAAERYLGRAADAGDRGGLNDLGNIMRELEDWPAAEDLYRRAYAAGNSYARVNLATLYARQGHWRRAEALYDGADLTDPVIVFNLGFLLERQGELRRAEELYGRFVADAGDHAVVGLGRCFREFGDLERAEEFCRPVAEAGDAEAMFELGLLAAQAGRGVQAEDWYRRAVAAGHLPAMNNLGNLLNGRGDQRGAERLYRQAVDGGNVGAVFNLAALHDVRGDTAAAERLYRLALKAGDLDVLNNLGLLLKHRGELDEAEWCYRQAIRAGDASALLNLGVLRADRGDWREAERLYRRALDLGVREAAANLAGLHGGRTGASVVNRRAVTMWTDKA